MNLNRVLFTLACLILIASFLILNCSNVFNSINDSGQDSDLEGSLRTETVVETIIKESEYGVTYILNRHTKKFHFPDCYAVNLMNENNKRYYTGDREDVIARGYVPCKKCKP